MTDRQTQTALPQLPMEPVLQVERWPDRKRKVLSKVDGNVSTVLATFVSDEAAAVFMETINDRLKIAYQLGKQAGANGVSGRC